MARTKRTTGTSGIYHILLRGQDKLFTDDMDYQTFLRTLREYFDGYRSFLLGYTLLPNRAHLIIDSGREPLANLMKPFCTSYARYFNRMHQKTGKLFYDRYKSVPLENGDKLAEAIAFIHAVPERADLADWAYSSLKEYAGEPTLCDTARTEWIAGGRRNLLRGEGKVMGLEDYVHMSDREIENYMRALCGYGFAEFRALAEKEQKAVLKLLKAQKWVKMPRLSALLGMELRPERRKRTEPEKELQKEELSVWLL